MKLYLFSNRMTMNILREGRIPFCTASDLADPFLIAEIPSLRSKPGKLSESAFKAECQRQYRALPAHLKNLVSEEFFIEEAKGKRVEIEKRVIQRTHPIAQTISPPLLKSIRIARFFEDVTDVSLWNSQGNQGHGAALQIDIAKTDFKERQHGGAPQKFDKLRYSQERPTAPSQQGTEPFRPLFHQGKSFASEEEWRLVRPETTMEPRVWETENLVCGNIPRAAVVGVVFGYQTKPPTIQAIHDLIALDMHFHHVKLYELKKDPLAFRLHLCEIQNLK